MNLHLTVRREDLSSLLAELKLDYDTPLNWYKGRAPAEGARLGVGYGSTLTSYFPRSDGATILAVVCSTNDKLREFSVEYMIMLLDLIKKKRKKRKEYI